MSIHPVEIELGCCCLAGLNLCNAVQLGGPLLGLLQSLQPLSRNSSPVLMMRTRQKEERWWLREHRTFETLEDLFRMIRCL